MPITKVLVERNTLSNIAGAIRQKGETTDTLTPAEMPQAIRDLPSGGVGEVESVTINNKSDFANITLPSTVGYYVTVPLNVTVLPANAPQITKVTVSDQSAAQVIDNGDGTHSVRFFKGGSIVVTVADYSGSITDSVTAVVNSPLQDIWFPYAFIYMDKEGTRQLDLKYKPSTTNIKDWVFSSDNPNITVSSTGLVTAVDGGEATISAYSPSLDKTVSVRVEAKTYIDTPDWAQIQADVRAGTSTISVGSTITDKFTQGGTEYDIVWRVADLKNVKKKDGTTVPGMYLILESGLPASSTKITFSSEQRVEATEPTAQANTYYFGFNGSTYTALNLQVGDAIPYADYTNVYKTGLPYSKSLSTIAQGYINSWDGSMAREYLNSEADNISLNYEPKHISDKCTYTGAGFLAGVNPNFLAVLQEVEIKTHLNTSCFDGQAITTYDKVFLPSRDELNFTKENSAVTEEGEPWKYFADEIGNRSDNAAPCRVRKQLTQSSASYWWLRSASRTTTYSVRCAISSGAINGSNANTSYQVVPACVIC